MTFYDAWTLKVSNAYFSICLVQYFLLSILLPMWTLLWNKSCISIFLKTKIAFHGWSLPFYLQYVAKLMFFFVGVSSVLLGVLFLTKSKIQSCLVQEKMKKERITSFKIFNRKLHDSKNKTQTSHNWLAPVCTSVCVRCPRKRFHLLLPSLCQEFFMIAVTWISDKLLLPLSIPFGATIDI